MITVQSGWNNATQEWEATLEDLPRPCVRARTLKKLREAIARLFGPDHDHPFEMIALSRNRTPAPTIH